MMKKPAQGRRQEQGEQAARSGARSEGSVLVSVILVLELLLLLALSALSLQKPEELKLLIYRDDPGMAFTLESLLLQGEGALRAGRTDPQVFTYQSDQVSGTMTMTPDGTDTGQDGSGVCCQVEITLRGAYLTKCYTGKIGLDAEGKYREELLLRMSET